jgi:hypothetical protein
MEAVLEATCLISGRPEKVDILLGRILSGFFVSKANKSFLIFGLVNIGWITNRQVTFFLGPARSV